MNGKITLAHSHLTPTGKFFCKGCNKHRNITERVGRYGKKCKHCAGEKS